MIAPAPTRQGFPSRAASSQAPQRWSIHSWLPRRPRAWQALACRAIMRRPHRVDLALSSGDVAGAGPAAHNRTLHIEAGLPPPDTTDPVFANLGYVVLGDTVQAIPSKQQPATVLSWLPQLGKGSTELAGGAKTSARPAQATAPLVGTRCLPIRRRSRPGTPAIVSPVGAAISAETLAPVPMRINPTWRRRCRSTGGCGTATHMEERLSSEQR